MTAFSYETRAARVVFASGSLADIESEVARLGPSRLLVIGTPGRKDDLAYLAGLLTSRVTAKLEEARVHVPRELSDRAIALARQHSADGVLALGGGSAIGLAKAVAHELRIPVIAVPTTYSGSEMTAVWGVTTGDAKQTGRDAGVAPVLVVYDPRLTLSLSKETSAASGMNAVAHCVEALHAADANPMSALFANRGLTLLAAALPAIIERPQDLPRREQALLGSHFAGRALDITTMGLHHKLAHALGGLGLPHALTHAILLPHTAAWNSTQAPEAMQLVAAILDAPDAATGIGELLRRVGITARLRDVGLREGDIGRAAAATPNADAAEGILRRAW